MSTIAITLRCDHDGCTETTDRFSFSGIAGWLENIIPLYDGVRMVLDYCPDHAEEHAPPEGAVQWRGTPISEPTKGDKQ